MRHTLRAHISYLETTIQAVRDRLAKPHLSLDEIQDLDLQLTLAQSALDHYRRAYELELSVTGPEPPELSGESESAADAEHQRDGSKKKEGFSLQTRRRRRRAPGARPVTLFATQRG